MLYILKFFYQWLLPPGIFILLLLGLAVWLWRRERGAAAGALTERRALRRGRWLVLAVAGALYVLSLRLGAWLLVAPLEQAIAQPAAVSGDVIVMLGNGSLADAPDLGGVGQPSGTMAKNMLAALRLQRLTGLPMVVSGGEVYAYSGNESDIAAREFAEMGLTMEGGERGGTTLSASRCSAPPPEGESGVGGSDKVQVFFERRSRNTAENLRFTHAILQEHGWQRPVIAVVALQAPRTALLAEREGLQAQIYPTHYRAAQRFYFEGLHDLVPNASALDDSAAALKEYLGILAMRFGYRG